MIGLMAGLDPFNLSDEAFESVMTAIDAEVRKRSKVIPGREMLALMEFTRRFLIKCTHRARNRGDGVSVVIPASDRENHKKLHRV